MKKTIYLYSSLIILAIAGTFLGYKAYGTYWFGAISATLVVVPAFYSVIPIINEQRQLYHSRKNRITEAIFTDRENDLEDIIRILNIQEHCVQITGVEEQCGKSWMAKRLCDYINYPKDTTFKNIGVRCAYLRADYIDMENYNEKEFNNYFSTNIVNSKTVLIFDHVTNFEIIFSKQKLFHFQMVYILKENENPALATHMISNFPQKHIEKLQRKINEIYSGISILTQSEIEALFQLTDGNIGRITALLSEQRCVSWIKDFSGKQLTEYEIELKKIEAEILIGKYQNANELLRKFDNKYRNDFVNNNHLAYKYNLILSDCKHMLNQYEDAITTLSLVELPSLRKYDINFEIELHKAHYYKHLWKCNDALQILSEIKNQSFSALVDALGILSAKYFINDLYVPETTEDSLTQFYKYFTHAQNSVLHKNNNDLHKLKRYAPIFVFYKQKPDTEDSLIKIIDDVIDIYQSENNRLLANAYFIKGEIYRLYKHYEKAITEYKKCQYVTIDENITLQSNLIIFYLNKVKNIEIEFPMLSETQLISLCQKNAFSNRVLHRINCIELEDPNANIIKENFDSRIMPIL